MLPKIINNFFFMPRACLSVLPLVLFVFFWLLSLGSAASAEQFVKQRRDSRETLVHKTPTISRIN
ncbi:Uncharacterized protein TCM_042901 [Theobroma cacao]|uniref:Uncharacterized protein n=1 Tax=Theobroma cacao TaxID=3641 RepID=A0A061FN42_THECC|nr:Uncharacterized protein TCM_042901 [Theobroma cacao]